MRTHRETGLTVGKSPSKDVAPHVPDAGSNARLNEEGIAILALGATHGTGKLHIFQHIVRFKARCRALRVWVLTANTKCHGVNESVCVRPADDSAD